MKTKNFKIVFGKLSKPVNNKNYFSAFLNEEGTEIDTETFTTHDFFGDAEQFAGLRQLSCINSGNQAAVFEIEGKVE